MASTQDLKRRLRSISNTRKLTRAMELVASARLRRAQQRIEAMRPYADRMGELMAGTAKAAGAVRLPLLQQREVVKTVAIVPITGDRGMAGAFNAQILRRSLALMRELQADGHEVVFFSSGKKAQSTLRFRRLPLIQAWTGFSDRPEYTDAQAIAHALAEAFSNEEVDRVVLVYNAFVSRARPARDRERRVCPSRSRRSTRTRRRPAARLVAADGLLLRARAEATSSSGCSRSTSRRSSTGRCSSRPRPSRARA